MQIASLVGGAPMADSTEQLLTSSLQEAIQKAMHVLQYLTGLRGLGK